jgi:hypothetical protein
VLVTYALTSDVQCHSLVWVLAFESKEVISCWPFLQSSYTEHGVTQSMVKGTSPQAAVLTRCEQASLHAPVV